MLTDCAAIMSCRRLSTLIALVVLSGLFATTVANLRVTGWDFYNGYHTHPFGSRTGTKKEIARLYCWPNKLECNLNLYFTEDASQPYYQIIGGLTTYFGRNGYKFCKATVWGNTDSGTRQWLMRGLVWNSCTNDWGYAFTYLYFRQTSTDPPFLQGIAYQKFKTDRNEMLREVVIAGTTTGAKHIEIAAYKTPSDKWSSSTQAIYLYISPTIIKAYKPLFDQRRERAISDSAMKSRVIVKGGRGKEFAKGMAGEITKQQTLEMTSTARWEKTFDFGLTQSFEFSGSICKVSNKPTTTLDFKWSTTNEMTKTKTKTSVSTYIWPKHCTPGYECKFSIFKKNTEISIPVNFTFQRGDETFTEMNTLVTTAETWHGKKCETGKLKLSKEVNRRKASMGQRGSDDKTFNYLMCL